MTDEEFIRVVESSKTMAIAAQKLGMSYTTFIRKAKKLECYKPNQGGEGVPQPKQWVSPRAFPLQEIFAGLHPKTQSCKLKHRLYKEGLKTNECEICGINEWNGKELVCELDHIDGNKINNKLENLRILCPNCHSQTETFRFKRGRGETGKHKTLKTSPSAGSSPAAHTK